jgi:hypothetical protein
MESSSSDTFFLSAHEYAGTSSFSSARNDFIAPSGDSYLWAL